MNLSNAKNSSFEKLFEKHSAIGTEIEARFGLFDGKSHFNPRVTQDQFARFYKFLDDKPEHYTHIYSEDTVKIYDDGIREISKAGETFYDKKENLGNFDIKDYNIRISFSKETRVEATNSTNVVHERFRSRHSFTSDAAKIRFDLDYCFQTGVFTMEVESLGCTYTSFYSNLVFLLQFIQESEVVISSPETKKVLMEYYKLAHKKKFIGVQPETISLGKLQKNIDYAITKKLDGKRALLISFEKNIYIITSTFEVKKLPYATSSGEKFIMDGEYFNGSFYIFDLCTSSLFLPKRLEEISHLLTTFIQVTETSCTITMKKYYFGDLYNNFSKMIADIDYDVYDGLVIVKTKAIYNGSSPLKWKPLNRLTIDFQIQKSDNTVSFLVCSEEGLTEFANNNVDDRILKYYCDNSIVECYWDSEKEVFIPVRHRPDKTKPNFIKVAQDNWNSIQNPFDIEKLKEFQSRKQASFFNMRRFHNWIKRVFIDKYSKDTVLDLACGKGGDFSKYIDSGAKYIEAYDICTDSLKEATNRKNHYLKKVETKNTSFKIEKKDLRVDLINSKYSFDLVVCNFAFHYFYKTLDVFITNILSNTKKGSYIALSFFDKEKLREETTDIYSIKKINEEQVMVHIKDSVLHSSTPEYLVDIPYVISKFAEYDIVLVENVSFSDMYKPWATHKNTLSLDERNLSFMNNICVFKI